MNYPNKEIVDSKSLTKLIKENEIVVLKFSAQWCGPCQNPQFKINYNMLKEKFNTEKIKFLEFDIDEDKDIVEDTEHYNFKIQSIPHFKICYKGNIINEINGSKLEEINSILLKLSN